MCQFLICWSHINGEGVVKIWVGREKQKIGARDMPKKRYSPEMAKIRVFDLSFELMDLLS